MINLNKLKLFFIIILLKGLVYASPLDKIPPQDLIRIKTLFKELFIFNYFSYTLIGSKPITVYSGGNIVDENVLTHIRTEALIPYYFTIWLKYNHLFPMKNYAFIHNYEIDGTLNIFFINKKNVLRVVEENLFLFQEYYGAKITPEIILEKILNSKFYYREFKKNEYLYGILFGFGTTNSMLFHLKEQLLLPIIDGEAFNTECHNRINGLCLPSFMVFESNNEVYNLRKKYEQERRDILKTYSQGNFLEITLNKLISD